MTEEQRKKMDIASDLGNEDGYTHVRLRFTHDDGPDDIEVCAYIDGVDSRQECNRRAAEKSLHLMKMAIESVYEKYPDMK